MLEAIFFARSGAIWLEKIPHTAPTTLAGSTWYSDGGEPLRRKLSISALLRDSCSALGGSPGLASGVRSGKPMRPPMLKFPKSAKERRSGALGPAVDGAAVEGAAGVRAGLAVPPPPVVAGCV